MGAKTAGRLFDLLQIAIKDLVHAVGALTACKERLDGLLKVLGDEKTPQDKWDKAARDFELCRKELVKKWGEWPRYERDCREQVRDLCSYIEQNKKKHKLRPLLKRDLDKVRGKVDDCVKSIDDCVDVIKTFEDTVKDVEKVAL